MSLFPTVPPTILSVSPVAPTYGNEQQNFTANFLSSFEADTTVTWTLNNGPLASQDLVHTEFANNSAGSSSLRFPLLSRADGGLYTVIIDNSMSLLPRDRSSVRESFTINVVGKCMKKEHTDRTSLSIASSATRCPHCPNH